MKKYNCCLIQVIIMLLIYLATYGKSVAQPTGLTLLPTQLIKTYLIAVQQSDIAKQKALLHPTVQWNQPGTHRFAGIHHSRTTILRVQQAMREATSQTFRLTVDNLYAVNGNQVACLINWQGVIEGGGVLNTDTIHVFTLKGNQIVHVTVYSADLAQEDWFWGK